MTAAKQKTPTVSNGGSDVGATYADLVNAEVGNLWLGVTRELVNVAGSANSITAASDATVVSAIAGFVRPMAFWLTPISDNTGPVDITIDGFNALLKDSSGADLGSGALKAGRRDKISFDGTIMRLASNAASGGSSLNGINGGRLTFVSGVPVMGSPSSGNLQVYWTPDDHNQIGLYDGAGSWNVIGSPEVQVKTTNVQSGTLHSGTKTIDGLSDTSQLVAGMKGTGTGVGAGAVIATVDTPTQVTMSVNSTGAGAATITFKCPADTGYDVVGQEVSSALKLFLVARGSILTANAIVKQDGIDVLSSDHTKRWLGAAIIGATDGQLDWLIAGQRRYRLWNRCNKRTIDGCESFGASGTWFKALGLVKVVSDCNGGGCSITVTGGSASFGSQNSANGGSLSADGVGVNGDFNLTGGGGMGNADGSGGRSIKNIMAASLNPTETVTIGSTTAPAHRAWIDVREVVEM